jgi:hypothetical protein
MVVAIASKAHKTAGFAMISGCRRYCYGQVEVATPFDDVVRADICALIPIGRSRGSSVEGRRAVILLILLAAPSVRCVGSTNERTEVVSMRRNNCLWLSIALF